MRIIQNLYGIGENLMTNKVDLMDLDEREAQRVLDILRANFKICAKCRDMEGFHEASYLQIMGEHDETQDTIGD